jgi:hypothetical protein
MAAATKTLNDFKNQMIDFLDELIEKFPQETKLVLGRFFIKDRISAQTLMDNFIEHIVPHRQHVLDRDDVFFLEHADALLGATSSLQHFRELWQSPTLAAADRAVIWDWFQAFLYLAESYVRQRA